MSGLSFESLAGASFKHPGVLSHAQTRNGTQFAVCALFDPAIAAFDSTSLLRRVDKYSDVFVVRALGATFLCDIVPRRRLSVLSVKAELSQRHTIAADLGCRHLVFDERAVLSHPLFGANAIRMLAAAACRSRAGDLTAVGRAIHARPGLVPVGRIAVETGLARDRLWAALSRLALRGVAPVDLLRPLDDTNEVVATRSAGSVPPSWSLFAAVRTSTAGRSQPDARSSAVTPAARRRTRGGSRPDTAAPDHGLPIVAASPHRFMPSTSDLHAAQERLAHAQELGRTDSDGCGETARRAVKGRRRLHQADGNVVALVPLHHRKGNRRPRFAPVVERLLGEAVLRFADSPEQPTVQFVARWVAARVREAEQTAGQPLAAPSPSTVRRRMARAVEATLRPVARARPGIGLQRPVPGKPQQGNH